MKRILLVIVFVGFTSLSFAQSTSFDDKARAYVKQFSAWAMEEQRRVGIPAAITLAQGIYETAAGESELATQANNHFGIKCKKEWRGETFAHTDDAPNECFRKYKSAQESYIDHSNYLKQSVRYAELFDFEKTNYVAWAKGLKRCGYATNPAYAQKLIKMIEDYDLQQFTLEAEGKRVNEMVPTQETHKVLNQEIRPDSVSAIVIQNTNLKETVTQNDDGTLMLNGLRALRCAKGETLLDKAMKYNIRYARLLEFNELDDEPLKRDMYIYLEPKRAKGFHNSYLVQEGETVELIAHKEGMNSRQLRIYNLLAQNEQPQAGSVVQLQQLSDTKPASYKMSKGLSTISSAQNVRLVAPNQNKTNDEYVATQKVVQQTEEIEIGYGAEPPAELKQQQPNTIQNDLRKVEVKTATPQDPEESQDEFTQLKVKLDKAVYARSPQSNIKVSRNDSASVFTQSAVTKTVESSTAVKTIPEGAYHTVVAKETLYSIAKKYGIKVKQLNEWNKLNFEGIKVGQKLRVK